MAKTGIWSEQERMTWLNFLRTFGEVNRRLCADMEQINDLPMSWYDVMVTLYQFDDEEGISMQVLAEHIMMSSSGLTRLVDRMIDVGLLRRKRAQDRRVVHVFLTDRGREKIEIVMPQHQARVQTYFLQHLTEAEMDTFCTVFERVIAAHKTS